MAALRSPRADTPPGGSWWTAPAAIATILSLLVARWAFDLIIEWLVGPGGGLPRVAIESVLLCAAAYGCAGSVVTNFPRIDYHAVTLALTAPTAAGLLLLALAALFPGLRLVDPTLLTPGVWADLAAVWIGARVALAQAHNDERSVIGHGVGRSGAPKDEPS